MRNSVTTKLRLFGRCAAFFWTRNSGPLTGAIRQIVIEERITTEGNEKEGQKSDNFLPSDNKTGLASIWVKLLGCSGR
jgi:hypothetical protein